MKETLRQEIIRLTEEYCGAWGINHTRRLLGLIGTIGAGLHYDEEVIWLAAHLHDWGAYAPWALPGVDHAQRSKQAAQEYLADKGLEPEKLALVLECIECHHRGGPQRGIEAILLSDADGLDFLGCIGLARDFAKNTKDLRAAYMSIKSRREKVPKLLCLERAKAMAAERLQRMDRFLAWFEEETGGEY